MSALSFPKLGLGWLDATSCGALRLSRHRSRGLTTGYFIRYHPTTICCGTYGSVLVAPRRGYWGNWGDSFVLLPRILWCWVSFAQAFLLGRLVYFTATSNTHVHTPFCWSPLLSCHGRSPSPSTFNFASALISLIDLYVCMISVRPSPKTSSTSTHLIPTPTKLETD